MVTNGQTAAVEATAIVATPLPVSLIDPSALNRHCSDEDPDIAELARTIAENGLFSAISARPRADGRYEIICGERRWRAFRLLQRETIPCIVKDLDDTQAQIERIVENFQRRDPSFMEQGEAVAALMKLTDRDVSEVANRLGQSASWVRRRAKLPNLIPAWREELAKEKTPYFAIRDSVGCLEELAVLPPATQQSILDTHVLRFVKTTREMRNIISKLFMDLEAKPWSREWEKKAFSGSGKKRCDACMKRSDRESALFADPDDPGTGKKMCLDPACWQNKCLAWCKSLINDNPGMVPIRQGYGWNRESLDGVFGVKPLSPYAWEERDETEAREGYVAAVGVIVDGPKIGTTKAIWLEAFDESDDGDSDVSEVHHWRESNAARVQERDALSELIAADIEEYLADIDAHAVIPSAQLADRKLRAGVWFGIYGYVNSEEEGASPVDPDWNPLAWAWEQTAERIAFHIAHVTAEDIAQLYNGDEGYAADKAIAAALAGMFAIPMDMIGARATDALYKATHEEAEADAQDNAGDEEGASDVDADSTDDADDIGQDAADDPETMEDPSEPVVAVDAEVIAEPDEGIASGNVSYLHILAKAQ